MLYFWILAFSDSEPECEPGCEPGCGASEQEKTAQTKSDENQKEISKKESLLWLNLSAAWLNQSMKSEAADAAQYAINADSENPKGSTIFIRPFSKIFQKNFFRKKIFFEKISVASFM